MTARAQGGITDARCRSLGTAIAIALLIGAILTAAQPIQATNPSGQATGGGLGQPGTSQTEAPTSLTDYLSNLYLWLMGFVGIAALFMIVLGGTMYMFSGAIETTTQAKKFIWNAVFGIVIAAASYLILYTINPDLVTSGFDVDKLVQQLTRKRPASPTAP